MSFPELLETALAGTPDARTLLRDAGLEGLRWLAGRIPDIAEPQAEFEYSAQEDRAEVPQAATARLVDILTRRIDALPEWLELVRERGLRLPPNVLPDVLDFGCEQRASLRELILDSGGARMVWLSKHNSQWSFAAYANPEDQFRWGPREDRELALRRIRRRAPDRGRELLRADLRSERGDNRVRLLAALEVGLSSMDEDVLQRAIGDARREVRETALRLMRLLPESQWATRWTQRATSALGQSGDPSVQADWEADGMDGHAPEDVQWRQLVAFTPPRLWPAHMLDVFVRRQPLLAGLAEAAAAYQDPVWCTRLILASVAGMDVRRLFRALDEQAATELLRTLVHSDTQKHGSTLATLLREAPWSVDPRLAPELDTFLGQDLAPMWLRPALVHLVDTLDYRLGMRRELDG